MASDLATTSSTASANTSATTSPNTSANIAATTAAATTSATKNASNADLDRNDFKTEYSINELLVLAKNDVFKKKTFLVNGKTKQYTAILHFFTSIREFNTKPKENVKFVCKEHGCKLEAPLGDFTNLNKHFINKPNNHPIGREWYILYKKKSKNSQEKVLSDQTLNLMKYFISSDTALEQLNNKFLRKVFLPDLKVFSVWTFRYKILPAVILKLKESIQSKLQLADCVTLVTDGWTGQFSNIEYMALCAQTINNSWEIELIVVGMVEMVNGHSAEEVKIAIEKMVNEYEFDKSKIQGSLSCIWN